MVDGILEVVAQLRRRRRAANALAQVERLGEGFAKALGVFLLLSVALLPVAKRLAVLIRLALLAGRAGAPRHRRRLFEIHSEAANVAESTGVGDGAKRGEQLRFDDGPLDEQRIIEVH